MSDWFEWTPDALRELAARRAGDGPSGQDYDPELLDALCDAADQIDRLRVEIKACVEHSEKASA